MTSDPWNLHRELACPSCHVVGKVVSCDDQATDPCGECYSTHEDPFTCVECGQCWTDAGMVGDVKEYRVQYMRLVEGRPYEPPRPKEPVKSKVDFSAFDGLLADYWREDIERRTVAKALDLSKLKKTSSPWVMPQIVTDPNLPRGYAFAVSEGAEVKVCDRTGAVLSVKGIATIRLGEDDTE